MCRPNSEVRRTRSEGGASDSPGAFPARLATKFRISDFGFRTSVSRSKLSRKLLLAVLFGHGLTASAVLPPAEQLLPPETWFVVTAPDWVQASAAGNALPLIQMWRDPAMKPVLTKLSEHWREQFVIPLELQWGVRLPELLALPRGQVTLALVPPGARAATTQPAVLFLADCGTNAPQLATNLAAFKQHWRDAGRNWRTEKLQGRDFAAFSLGGAEPESLREALFPKRAFQDVPGTDSRRTVQNPIPASGASGTEFFLGQVDSLLVASDSAALIEGVLARLAGRELPTLAGQAAFARQGSACFRSALLCGWANLGALLARDAVGDTNSVPADIIAQNPENALFLSLHAGSLLRALGLETVEGAAFRYTVTREGALSELRLDVRDGQRPRLLDGLAGTSVDCTPPLFVPAAATEFDRWRFSGPKALAALGGALDAISPHFSSAWNFLLDTASDAAKQKHPDFDLRPALAAGLGEDFIHWDLAPAGSTAGGAAGPRSVYVLASPDSERLVAALKALVVLFPQQDGDATEREFLGRKIYSIPLPSLPGATLRFQGPRTLAYAASANHVVLATDAALVEEFLRGAEAQTRPLNEKPGLDQARARVTDAGACAFGYWNHQALARAGLEMLKKNPPSGASLAPLLPLPDLIAEPLADEMNLGGMLEAPLLPPFERIAKYFHYSVYGLSASATGVTLKCFSPSPPELDRAR